MGGGHGELILFSPTDQGALTNWVSRGQNANHG